MGTSTKVNGKTIKPMAKVSSLILTMQDTKEIGWTICNMATEWRRGIMELPSIQGNSTRAKKVGKADLSGKMEVIMRETSLMDSSKDLANITLLI
jgi:hypothetical protein